jgi:hypothetical protein
VLGLLVLLLIGVYPFLRRGSAREQARNPELVALYNRGIQALERRTQTGSAEATQIFSAVLARDSSYGDAWTALAQTYVRADIRGFVIPGVPSDSIIDAAVRAVDRALALDSNSAAAWRVRGTLSERIDPTDDAAALQSIRHAIALDSTQPESFVLLGMYLTETGDPDGRHCGGASLPGPESDQYPVPRLPWDFLLLAPPVRQRGRLRRQCGECRPGLLPGADLHRGDRALPAGISESPLQPSMRRCG